MHEYYFVKKQVNFYKLTRKIPFYIITKRYAKGKKIYTET